MTSRTQPAPFQAGNPERIAKNLRVRVGADGAVSLLALYSKLTDPRGWGRTHDDAPAWANSEAHLLRCGASGRFPRKMTNEALAEHLAGGSPLYVSAGGTRRDPNDKNHYYRYTLAGIDIDAGGRHKVGSAAGARRYLERVVKPLFGDHLLWEPSTHGEGIHAPFLLYRCRATDMRNALNWLQLYLRAHVRPDDDIAGVEIKGMPTEYLYSPEGRLTGVRRGSLIRMPRTADWRRLLSTSMTDCQNLMDLQIPEPPKAVRRGVIPFPPTGTEGDSPRATVNPPSSTPSSPVEVQNTPAAAPPDMPLRSRSGAAFMTHGDMAKLPQFEKKAQHLLNRFPLDNRVRNGKRVERADVAIFLLVVSWLSKAENACENGTMPHKRIRNLWQTLFTDAHVTRSPANERIALIRDWLSGIDAIEWTDASYSPTTPDQPGFACKWRIKDEVVSWLESTTYDTHTFTVPSCLRFTTPIQPRCAVPSRQRGWLTLLGQRFTLLEPTLYAHAA